MKREIMVAERTYRAGDIVCPPGGDTERIYLIGFSDDGKQGFGLKLTKDLKLDSRCKPNGEGWNIILSFVHLSRSDILHRNVTIEGIQISLKQSDAVSQKFEQLKKEPYEHSGVDGKMYKRIMTQTLDDIEWFMDAELPTTPAIGVNSSGISFNQSVMQMMDLGNGDLIRIGLTKDGHLVIKKDKHGIRLRKANDNKTVIVQNKQLVTWLAQKNIKKQRYPITHDQQTDAWMCKLEVIQGAG